MRIAVIRGDISSPLFLADLEPTVHRDGGAQTRYISRPDPVRVQAYLDSQSLVAVAATLILATVPIGGPVDVSSATIKAVGSLSGATVTQVTAIQDLLAPRIIETTVARASWTSGNIKKLRNATFTPDPNRFSTGAAIVVVQDDGVTLYVLDPP